MRSGLGLVVIGIWVAPAGEHVTRSLFVTKTFEVSRSMHGWGTLQLSEEERRHGSRTERGHNVGLAIGTTFR